MPLGLTTHPVPPNSVTGTPFDPDRIAGAYWAIRNEDPDAWREEYRFDGAVATRGDRATPRL